MIGIKIGTVAWAAVILVLSSADDSKERARHEGRWVVTAMIRDGRDAPAEIRDSIRRVVEGDHVVWTREGKNFAGTRFKIDPTKQPATIDLIPDGGRDRDKQILGIYKFEGESLTICVADADRPRPTAFEAKPGSKQTLQTFRRETPPSRPTTP